MWPAHPWQTLPESGEQPAGLAELECQHRQSEAHREQAGARQYEHDNAGKQKNQPDHQGERPPDGWR